MDFARAWACFRASNTKGKLLYLACVVLFNFLSRLSFALSLALLSEISIGIESGDCRSSFARALLSAFLTHLSGCFERRIVTIEMLGGGRCVYRIKSERPLLRQASGLSIIIGE